MISRVIDVFPSQCGNQRIVLASMLNDKTGVEQLMLRQESRSADVGWFVQSCIGLEPEQATALKMVLSAGLLTPGTADGAVSRSVIPFPVAVA